MAAGKVANKVALGAWGRGVAALQGNGCHL